MISDPRSANPKVRPLNPPVAGLVLSTYLLGYDPLDVILGQREKRKLMKR